MFTCRESTIIVVILHVCNGLMYNIYLRTPYSIEDQSYRHIRTIDIYDRHIYSTLKHAHTHCILHCTLKHVRIFNDSTLPSAIGHHIEYCNLLEHFPHCSPFVPTAVSCSRYNNDSIVCHICHIVSVNSHYRLAGYLSTLLPAVATSTLLGN